MKKIISILIAIIIFTTTLVGCTTGTQADSNTRDYTTDGKETKLMPDENATGELTISYCGNNVVAGGNSYFKAIEIFKELYPNVDVKFDFVNALDFSSSEMLGGIENYYKQLQTKIMAGNAPDVFEIIGDFIDIPKAMRSGSLANMYDYFENDPYFNADDYNQTILKSGQYKGGQYIVPRSYGIPLFMTTKEIASIIGYNENKKMDYYETWDFLLELNDEHKDKFQDEKLIGNMAMPDYFPCLSGVDFLDAKEMRTNFETEDFKALIKKQKEILKTFPYARLFIGNPSGGVYQLKRKEMALWSFNCSGIDDILQNIRRLDVENAVIIPFRDINKRLQATTFDNVAVSESSKNKENAYRFIKILINEDVSARYDTNYAAADYYIPISNIAIKKLLQQGTKDEILMYEDGLLYEYKKATGLSNEFIDKYILMINDIDNVFFMSPEIMLLQEAFQPYFDDEMSYEKCLETARDAVDIYLSE